MRASVVKIASRWLCWPAHAYIIPYNGDSWCQLDPYLYSIRPNLAHHIQRYGRFSIPSPNLQLTTSIIIFRSKLYTKLLYIFTRSFIVIAAYYLVVIHKYYWTPPFPPDLSYNMGYLSNVSRVIIAQALKHSCWWRWFTCLTVYDIITVHLLKLQELDDSLQHTDPGIIISPFDVISIVFVARICLGVWSLIR